MSYNRKFGNQKFIFEDGTKLFLSERVYNSLIKKGCSMYCIDSVKLILVTVNPVSPFDYRFESEELLYEISKELGVYTCDCVLQICYFKGERVFL